MICSRLSNSHSFLHDRMMSPLTIRPAGTQVILVHNHVPGVVAAKVDIDRVPSRGVRLPFSNSRSKADETDVCPARSRRECRSSGSVQIFKAVCYDEPIRQQLVVRDVPNGNPVAIALQGHQSHAMLQAGVLTGIDVLKAFCCVQPDQFVLH